MQPIISIANLTKTYDGGHVALNNVSLDINEGEIFGLLGPNGAGKTTLISIICSITKPGSGTITVGGFDIITQSLKTRAMIGLVPQELTTDAFESVWDTVSFTRGLYGKGPDREHIEKVLTDLSLWDRKDAKIMELSGGMKRRVLIAKALSHQPKILFLDEPTAGVDVELRKDMWQVVRELRASGVTIILTTHYIDEAEEMADRIGVINNGEIILVEGKTALMEKLGTKKMSLELHKKLKSVPRILKEFNLALSFDGMQITYSYDTRGQRTGITALLNALNNAGIKFKDINTTQSSLEEIFVNLVKKPS